MWKWHQWIPGVLPINWAENNWNWTIFNENGLWTLQKDFSRNILNYGPNYIIFGPFSVGRHKESIGNTFINTCQKHEHFMWARRFYCSGLSTGGLLGSEGPRYSEKAKQWGGIYHIKCSCFWEVLIKVLPIDSLCLPDENGPKNDVIRTIIKYITWEIFLKSSKPVSLKIVRFQLFSVQLIGRTPGIHWCHFHIDTMKNKRNSDSVESDR